MNTLQKNTPLSTVTENISQWETVDLQQNSKNCDFFQKNFCQTENFQKMCSLCNFYWKSTILQCWFDFLKTHFSKYFRIFQNIPENLWNLIEFSRFLWNFRLKVQKTIYQLRIEILSKTSFRVYTHITFRLERNSKRVPWRTLSSTSDSIKFLSYFFPCCI